MNDLILQRKNCRLCGSGDLEMVLQLAQVPIVDAYVTAEHLGDVQEKYPLDIYLCRACGNAQLRDVLDPEVLYGDYIYDTASSLGLIDHFQEYASEVMRWGNPFQGSLVVDVGSNDGSLLRFFQNKGMKVLGIDPAKEIALAATESGVETWPRFFDAELAGEVKKKHGPATIVTVNNLFANVDDLEDMIEGIREMLAPDGFFVFETFYLLDLVKNLAFDFIYHEHLSCFSVKPLEAFFRAHGMQLVDVQRVPTKAGSVRGFVRLADAQPKASSSVGRLISLETELGLHSSEVFSALSARIDNAKNRFVALLQQIQAQRKTIAGYGASAATTTLIYQFEFGEMLSFIVDDNPRRQNLFSPGLHIPVLAPEAIYEKDLEHLVILAWRHGQAIMEKHPAFKEKGGQFIVPLPEMKVI